MSFSDRLASWPKPITPLSQQWAPHIRGLCVLFHRAGWVSQSNMPFSLKQNHTGGWLWSAWRGCFREHHCRSLFFCWALKWLESSYLRNVTIISVLWWLTGRTGDTIIEMYESAFSRSCISCLYSLLWVSYESRRVCHHWSQTAISWIYALSLLMVFSYGILFPSSCGCYLGSLGKKWKSKQDKAVSRQWLSGC